MKNHTNMLFQADAFTNMLEQGYVRVNTHPDNSELFILNYTEKAAFDGVWNDVTMNCRGLVVDAFNWIVARPLPKFFNYGQPGCPTIDLDEPAVVSDKKDGSLGILYCDPSTGMYAIATRGSFTSEQAIHATELFRSKYASYVPPKGITLLFEIIYPENRIVCDYNGMDDLVLLASVDISTGDNWDAGILDWGWPGPKAEVFPYTTFREALAAEPRPGKEGFVVNLFQKDIRVKVKQADYIALHRIVTGLNARTVWQAMIDGNINELIEQVPDEFHDFIRGVQHDIDAEVDEFVEYCCHSYDRILAELGPNPSKKDFAIKAKDHNYSWALFQLYDNKNIRPAWLKRCKPEHNYSPVKVSNDAD